MKFRYLLLLILLLGIYLTPEAQVIINEVCSHNGSLIEDEDDEDPDWIELFNKGTSVVSLSGYSLKSGTGIKWFFPDVTIPAHNYLLVFASGKDRHGAILHTSFKLSKEGETIWLLNPDLAIIDKLSIGHLQLDHSFGRIPDGNDSGQGIFDSPTPGTSNDSSIALQGYAEDPLFSLDAGFYAGKQSLSILYDPAAAIVHFTTDGSLPIQTSAVFEAPFAMDSSIVIRARAFSIDGSKLPSEIITNSYFIDYSSELPVFSISTDPYNLWDWDHGIYVLGPNASAVYPYYGANFWQEWEIPAHIEFFESNRKQMLEQDAGVSINGGSVSRTRPQQSLRLTARDKYGTPDFNYQFFEEKGIDHFKMIVLRNSSGDFNKTQFRDGSLHKLMLGHVDIDLLCYRPAVVFLNGQYWGVQNIREKISKYYLQENYGIDPDAIDLLEEDSTVIHGDFTAFHAMHDFVTTADMALQANYDSACNMLDMKSFCDYIIAETFLSNIDWPYNNMKYWKEREAGRKWRYLLMDLDISLGNYGWAPASMDVFGRLFDPFGDNNKHVQLLKSLLNNQSFRYYFINRYADLVNTLFSVQNMKENLAEVKQALESEMPAHFKRWGNSMQAWNDEINGVVIPYIEDRPGYAMQFVQEHFALDSQVNVELDIWPPGAGTIRINTIEPSLPWNGTYFNGVPITLSIVPNPGYSFTSWTSDRISLEDPTLPSITVNVDTNNRFTAFFGKLSDSEPFTLFPNPARELLYACFQLGKASPGIFGVYSLEGKEVYRTESTLFSEGLNHANLRVSGLLPGVYIIKLNTDEGIKSAKVVIYQ